MNDILAYFALGLFFSVFGTVCWFRILRPLGEATAAKWGAVISGGAMLFTSVFYVAPPLAYGMGAGSGIGAFGALYMLLRRGQRV